MLHDPDIVNIDVGLFGLRQKDWVIPETEVINAIRTFRDGQKRFPINAFHSANHQNLAVVFDRTGIKD